MVFGFAKCDRSLYISVVNNEQCLSKSDAQGYWEWGLASPGKFAQVGLGKSISKWELGFAKANLNKSGKQV